MEDEISTPKPTCTTRSLIETLNLYCTKLQNLTETIKEASQTNQSKVTLALLATLKNAREQLRFQIGLLEALQYPEASRLPTTQRSFY